jgi:hypothetical protein
MSRKINKYNGHTCGTLKKKRCKDTIGCKYVKKKGITFMGHCIEDPIINGMVSKKKNEFTHEMIHYDSENDNNKFIVSSILLGRGSFGSIYNVTKIELNGNLIELDNNGIVFKKLNKTPNISNEDLQTVLETLDLNTKQPDLKGIFCLKDKGNPITNTMNPKQNREESIHRQTMNDVSHWTSNRNSSDNSLSLSAIGWFGQNLIDSNWALSRQNSEIQNRFNMINHNISNLNNSNNGYCKKDMGNNCFFMTKLHPISSYNVDSNIKSHIKNIFKKLIDLYEKDLLCLDIKHENIMYNDNGIYIIDPDGFFNYSSLNKKINGITYDILFSASTGNLIPTSVKEFIFMPSLYIKYGRIPQPLRKINIFLSSMYLLMKIFIVNIYNNDIQNLIIPGLKEINKSKKKAVKEDDLAEVAFKYYNNLNNHKLKKINLKKLYSKILKKIIDTDIKAFFEAIIRFNYDDNILNNNTKHTSE